MRILFDLGHPADVHLFKNSIWICERNGHEVKVVCRPRDNVEELLSRYQIPVESIGHFQSVFGKLSGIFHIGNSLNRICRKFRPQLLVNFGSPYSAHISFLYNVPNLTLIDTEPEKYTIYYWYYRVVFQPFVKRVFVPESYSQNFRAPDVIRYKGFKELAYLHPDYFEPDRNILKKLGCSSDEKVILVKFAAWDAIHDLGHGNFESNQKYVDFISELEKFGRVFISSEVHLPELEHLYVDLPPGDIHHLLAFSSLYVGEGATMAAEAGVLGVPWVFIHSRHLGYLDFQEKKYGLGKTCACVADALAISEEFLKDQNNPERWQLKREKLLSDHVDVTGMILDEINRYENLSKN